MAKVLNILFLLFIGFSCTQEKVPASPFLDEGMTFLLGKWEWEKSVVEEFFVSANGRNFEHKKASESSKDIQLIFSEDGRLQVIENATINEYDIEDYRISQVENNTVVKFLINNEAIILIYNNINKRLSTVKSFFILEPHPCDLNNQIVNNVFKKI